MALQEQTMLKFFEEDKYVWPETKNTVERPLGNL